MTSTRLPGSTFSPEDSSDIRRMKPYRLSDQKMPVAALERKIKAVIDTNLFVNGLFSRNTIPSMLQDHWINLDFVLVTSIDIIKEVNQVFHYPRIQEQFAPDEEKIR